MNASSPRTEFRESQTGSYHTSSVPSIHVCRNGLGGEAQGWTTAMYRSPALLSRRTGLGIWALEPSESATVN